MLSWSEIESNAVVFQKRWKNNPGDERQSGQTFQKDFMEIFGVDWREGLHEYQIRDSEGRLNYIDYLLPGKILIEMKSKGESLIRAYNQAAHYVKNLNPEDQPELLLVSDFEYFEVTNVRTGQTFKKFKLNKLKHHVRMFGVLAGYNSEVDYETDIKVNTDASYMMAKLHDELKEHGYGGKDLELYLVRLLFCLFAEDTGIFDRNAFERYLKRSNDDGSDLSSMLMQLFDVLDTPEEKRMPALKEQFREFRYIDGQVFSDRLPSAWFSQKMRETLISCTTFDWSYISPAIFGSMFQGVMDPEERRELGAHYTSEENIMKVIKPLFLDELWDEFETVKTTVAELQTFQEKLGNLIFLDPACGSGNFLIVAYRELRLLEFEVMKLIQDNRQLQIVDVTGISKVSVNQFYGIELDEFACEIAQLGMLLIKHQMDQLVSNWLGMNTIDFPIRENPHIVHGNALRIDWSDVVPINELTYILGNPPFVGAMLTNDSQNEDIKLTMGHIKGYGELDYVCGWFYKAALIMNQNPDIKASFVATNSISQGQSVATFWRHMVEAEHIRIDFAYRTFRWDNKARGRAAVHCVIIGFSKNYSPSNGEYLLFAEDETLSLVENIHPYLINAPNIFIEAVSKPLTDVSEMRFGSMPRDGGNLIVTDEEREELIRLYPQSKEWIRPYIGAREFINRTYRWVLWLVDINPMELRRYPKIAEKVEKVRLFRLNSKAAATRKFAETPSLFCQIAQPEDGHYILVPRVSSEKRRYIPIGFLNHEVIASDATFMIPEGTLYEFGVLISATHMAWMRLTAGRLKSDYRYAKDIVYNTFPWPEANEADRLRIENSAQAILDARDLYPTYTYADLYDDTFMPPELRSAHTANNKAVREAYRATWMTEEECIADLLQRYKELLRNR